MEGRSSNNEKKGRYKIMKTQKKYSKFCKMGCKGQNIGKCVFYDLFTQMNTPILTFLSNRLLYFPT